MNRTEREKMPPAPLPVPDSPKDPIKPADSTSATPPEIPKVGTKDAPGG